MQIWLKFIQIWLK